MWSREKTFAVAVTCADWRLHQPRVNLYGQLCRSLHVDGVFLNAVPGPDGLRNTGREGDHTAVVAWLKLFAGRPFTTALALVAHQACIAHSVSNEQHEIDVARVAETLKRDVGYAGPMMAFVAVRNTDAKWSLKEIARF